MEMMIKRSIEEYPSFKIFITSLHHQLYITASVTKYEADAERLAEEMYRRVADHIAAFSGQIILERCFGKMDFRTQLLANRSDLFRRLNIETDTPVTYVEGASCLGGRFSGIQIRVLKTTPTAQVRTMMSEGISKGRMWKTDGSTFFLLHDIRGEVAHSGEHRDRKTQSEMMFRQAEKILHAEGAAYQDVVRTWIYISDILDWYDDFNVSRNKFFSEYGLLGNAEHRGEAEQKYFPASTGIGGRNSANLPATMDVFAVHRSPESSVQIRPLYGRKQRSPYRYGSAFSRAMVVEDAESKMIFVSGTASIDEEGKSVFIGDAEAQIRHALQVVSALVAEENATLHDLCETTLFFKRSEDVTLYHKVAEQLGITNIPSVNVIADVCRDELLFELDAALLLAK
ncbi:MAG TPA: RidA family protein [Bacteroidota bacterium]|nr:RidA family protein [Bacteroidota bacterium]